MNRQKAKKLMHMGQAFAATGALAFAGSIWAYNVFMMDDPTKLTFRLLAGLGFVSLITGQTLIEAAVPYVK